MLAATPEVGEGNSEELLLSLLPRGVATAVPGALLRGGVPWRPSMRAASALAVCVFVCVCERERGQ
eukprot:1145712-Pelagomonas_calceolata.AAC.4